jgi:hypothetical protein
MNPAERRRLKRLGKRLVEQRSRELEDALREANPAPSGSDEWARGYRAGVERERRLRASPPDRLTAEEARRDFVLLPVGGEGLDGLPGAPTWYYQCPSCGDLLHSGARTCLACACGGLAIDIEAGQVAGRLIDQARLVKLVGRADPPAPAARRRD